MVIMFDRAMFQGQVVDIISSQINDMQFQIKKQNKFP